MIATQANLTHSQTPVQLTISTDALVLKRTSDSQVLCSHRMEGISFASAGEHVRQLPIDLFSLDFIFFRIQKII